MGRRKAPQSNQNLSPEELQKQEELKQRFRLKLAEKKLGRLPRASQEKKLDEMKQQFAEKTGVSFNAMEQMVNPTKAKNQKKQQRKKMKELYQRYGEISKKQYLEVSAKLKEDNYSRDELRNQDTNIIKLYQHQQNQKMQNVREITSDEADKVLLEGLDEDLGDDGDDGDDESSEIC